MCSAVEVSRIHLEVAEKHELKRARIRIHLCMSARTRSLHLSTRVQTRTSAMQTLVFYPCMLLVLSVINTIHCKNQKVTVILTSDKNPCMQIKKVLCFSF